MKAATIFCAALLAATLASYSAAASNSNPHSSVFHATIPAGYDVLLIQPGDRELTLLGLIECPELEGAQQVTRGMQSKIVNAGGEVLAHFPSNFSFRITASLRKTLLMEPTDVFEISEEPQALLLKFGFRLKVYHGLEVREIQPESVQMIGVPGDIPYDERIYRISFNVDDLPVTDRCVLEVLSPDGERLTRFHFDLL